FEKDDGTAALGHRQCRRDAREAAADDTHVGLNRAFERRMARPVIGGRGVVRSYVILSLHERTISLHPSQAQILREVTSHSLHGRPPRRPSRAKSDIFVLHWLAGSSPAIELVESRFLADGAERPAAFLVFAFRRAPREIRGDQYAERDNADQDRR